MTVDCPILSMCLPEACLDLKTVPTKSMPLSFKLTERQRLYMQVMNVYCYIEKENQKSKSGSSYSVVVRLPKCSFPVKYKTDIFVF